MQNVVYDFLKRSNVNSVIPFKSIFNIYDDDV